MNDVCRPNDDQDGSKLLESIAAPLLDLRDRSFNAGLRTSDVEAGDLQSQLLLAYRSAGSDVFARKMFSANRLGLHKFLQALTPIPLAAAAITAVELFFVAPGVLALPIADFFLVFFAVFALVVLDVALGRSTTAGQKLRQPDRIIISPQGLNLQWSGRFFSYIALVLPWRRIALAYYELDHGADGADQRVLCLRDNVGKALRLDASACDESILVHNLTRRAPWAVKAAPKILASQPTQKTRWRYICQWLWQMEKDCKQAKKARQLCPEEVVAGRYRIVAVMPPSARKNLYLAQIETEATVSRQWLSEEKEAPAVAPHVVRLQQWLLPGSLSRKQRYDLFNELEHRIRWHSAANFNSINRWLDVFVENMAIFVVSEHDQAPTLRQHVQDQGPLSEMVAKTAAVEMIDVLSYLHKDQPLLLKNINPDAWIRFPDGKIKLDHIDVDLYLTPSRFESLGIDRRYCSVDLLRGVPSVQADIYALGATLYFLVTGKDPQPFQSCNPQSDGASISTEFNAIIVRAADADVSQRYRSAQEMKADLLALAAVETNLLLL